MIMPNTGNNDQIGPHNIGQIVPASSTNLDHSHINSLPPKVLEGEGNPDHPICGSPIGINSGESIHMWTNPVH
jgi:hypothetical protein